MNNHCPKPVLPASVKAVETRSAKSSLNAPDDGYPGSFFRIPGIPMPGKTTWRLSK